MSQMIIRLYDAVTQAAKAAEELRDAGFKDVFEYKSNGGKGAAAAKSRDALVADLLAAQVYRSHAQTYAEKLAKGGAMVLVHAPFGAAVKAARILDAHGPSSGALEDGSKTPDYTWDEAAPLSSALRLPTLINGLPFEILTGASSLTKGKAFISDLVGMPLLSRGLAHAASSFGLPLLSHSATPLSSMLGLRVLSSNPTPLSSMLGLSVLKR